MAETTRAVVRSWAGRLAATTGRIAHWFERTPESDEFLRRLIRNYPGMAFRRRRDEAWTLEYVSAGGQRVTGFDGADLVENGRVAYRDLVHAEDRARVEEAIREAAHRGGSYAVDYRIRRVDGRERRVLEQATPILGFGGRVEAVEGCVTDITEQYDLAQRSSRRDDQFKALVEQSLVGVYVIQEGRFVYANPRLAEILGYTVPELLALPTIGVVVHPDDRALVTNNVRRRLEGEVVDLRYEFRTTRPSGEVRVVEVHGRRIELDGGAAVMGTLLDITERKRTEQRYHEAQMLEALGRLATGVAHDLNNFLTVIKSTAELANLERPDDAALAADMREIVVAAERGAALGRQLTRFGRRRTDPVAAVSLAVQVHELQPVLERLLGKDVQVNAAIDPNVSLVPLDPTCADEVIMNLVLNARDAMPGGGAIHLSVRERTAEPGSADAGRGRTEVVLEVTDTGVGIASEHLRHIFEPYFTTKGDKGTGLGLSNVWRLVTDAGGRVDVESTEGVGSTFRVVLPIVRDAG